jgi:hypothetical protein
LVYTVDMTERNNHTLVTVIIILAIIVCVFLLIRYPPGFSAYSPASAASFSTYNTNPNNYSGSFSANPYNQYGGAAYPAYNQATTTYPVTTYTTYPTRVISNFNDCVNAGYPVMQTYPEQCRTPEGQTFTQQSTTTTTTQTQYQYSYPITNPVD